MGRMRVRRIARIKDGSEVDKEIVWFGSYGRNSDGSSKFFNPENKHDNFAESQQYVADALTQKLNILQGELWWNVTYGLPLLQKLTSKTMIDTVLIQTISEHPDVLEITSFESDILNHSYHANIEIVSTFGSLSLSI